MFVAEAQNAIEISYVSGPLQQAGVFELFDVGEVAQTGQTEHLQKLPRRDIGVGRAGFRRARAGGDEVQTLQPADDVAADFLAKQPRQFSAWWRAADRRWW